VIGILFSLIVSQNNPVKQYASISLVLYLLTTVSISLHVGLFALFIINNRNRLFLSRTGSLLNSNCGIAYNIIVWPF
jgi:hypothetical protein